jgi:hypothetical protein
VLDSIEDNSSSATRACAIYKLQNFLKYDQQKVLECFLKLSKDYSPGIIKIAIYPLQYLVNYDFKALQTFFEKAMNVNDAGDTIGHILTKAYCFNYANSETLLNSYYLLGEDRINSSIKIAMQFLDSEKQVDRALSIIERFTDNKNEKIAKTYSFAFHHLEVRVFKKILNFLHQYTVSNVGKHREYPFYNYLLKCSNEYPQDCIALISDFETHFGQDVSLRRLSSGPMNVIIQSYNAIRDYNITDESLEKAMDVFDNILQDSEYRGQAFEVLNDVDMY